MSDDAESSARAAHRLVDIVVEEVSLVDRAANRRTFLIVKRDDTMDFETPSEPLPDVPTVTQEPAQESTAGAEDSVLTDALAALEGLTTALDLLREHLPTAPTKTAEASASADAAGTNATPAQTGAPANPPAPPQKIVYADEFADQRPTPIERAVELLSTASANVQRLQEALANTRPPTQLDALTKAIGELTAKVATQSEALGRVEKRFLPPNRFERETPPPQRDDIWPLDLNAPNDRSSVDPSISFHD